MKIELDREALKKECKKLPASKMRFESFVKPVRDALVIAKESGHLDLVYFWENDRSTYRRIIIPTCNCGAFGPKTFYGVHVDFCATEQKPAEK